jgi:hypothetical protein
VIAYRGGGLVEIETTQFIRQYLDGRTVLQKIFDPHVGFHVLMFSLMIARHPPVYEWRHHRLWYYPLTFQITLAFCLLAAAAHAAQRGVPR